MNIEKAINQLPKTDLHCHLDGSMRAETILALAGEDRVDLGTHNLESLKKKLVCGEPVHSLPDFLKAFDITCSVMQTASAIERIAFELAEDAHKENVRYLEVRFAPLFCTKRGLTGEEVMLAAQKGLKKAEKKYPIQTGLIVCAIRVFDPKVSVELAQLAVSLKNSGVVGFDLAHAESGNRPGKHAEAYKIAKKGGLGLTVHAGEDFGPESIREAIDECFAMRIGHGRTLVEDPDLEKRVIRESIFIECCPSSNVQIGLTKNWSEHPVKGYIERGVPATLNTDNRLLTGINVTDEYLRAYRYLNMTWEQMKTTALNGFKAAFLLQNEKEKLLKSVEQEIREIEKIL